MELHSIIHIQEMLDEVAKSGLLGQVLVGERSEVGEGPSNALVSLMNSGSISFFLHTASQLKPRVLESFSSRDTNVFLAEDTLDEVFGLIRNIIPAVSFEAVFTCLDLLDDLRVCITVEGRLTTEKDVKDDTHAPNITLLTVGACNNLRSHVVRGTEDAMHSMLVIDTS